MHDGCAMGDPRSGHSSRMGVATGRTRVSGRGTHVFPAILKAEARPEDMSDSVSSSRPLDDAKDSSSLAAGPPSVARNALAPAPGRSRNFRGSGQTLPPTSTRWRPASSGRARALGCPAACASLSEGTTRPSPRTDLCPGEGKGGGGGPRTVGEGTEGGRVGWGPRHCVRTLPGA